MVAATRNETTTAALLAVASSIFTDPRVQVVFAIPPDRSAFSADLETSLRSRGLLVTPWHRLDDLKVDLVISASHAGAPLRVDAPVLFLPHGYGRTRDLSTLEPARPGDRVGDHRAVHAAPHECMRSVLPGWGEVAVVGDPIFDSLLNARSQARHIRDALGLRSRQRLLTISSTWRENSLFATRPALCEELLAELPADEYAVAVILHPNIWTGHGRWQTQTWLQPALDAGLRLVPFEEGWRPTIAAADIVIGDHGSVTFYADLLGKPVLRVVGGLDELTHGTPLAERVQTGPRLSRRHGLRTQVESVETPPDDTVEQLVNASIRHPRQSHRRLRELAYDLLGLQPPLTPARDYRPPVPQAKWTEPACHWATLLDPSPSSPPFPPASPLSDPRADSLADGRDAQASSGPHRELLLERRAAPSVLIAGQQAMEGSATVMVATLGRAVRTDAERATVLLLEPDAEQTMDTAEAVVVAAMRSALEEYPGCLVLASAHGGAALVLRPEWGRPLRFGVRGIDPDDERAMTTAALITLRHDETEEPPDNRPGSGPLAGTVRMRCGQARWRMTPPPAELPPTALHPARV